MRFATLFTVSLGFMSAALAAPPSNITPVGPLAIDQLGMDGFELESLLQEQVADDETLSERRMEAGLVDTHGERPPMLADRD